MPKATKLNGKIFMRKLQLRGNQYENNKKKGKPVCTFAACLSQSFAWEQF